MSASLFVIEQSLVDLEELRATLVDEGDSEAIAVVDQQIAEWQDRTPAKVASSRAFVLQQETMVAACKAEEDRIRAIRKRAESSIERYKAYVLAIMQRFDVKELKAENIGGFRRQGNGGLEPLDIPDWPKDASGNFKALREHDIALVNFPSDFPVKALYVPDTEKIREEFKRRVVCPQCKGCGEVTDGKESVDVVISVCPRCHGERTVPATLEGARLLPRGEHVRVI